MNIGAIVVTSSREMIRGLVRVTRSAPSEGCLAPARLGRPRSRRCRGRVEDQHDQRRPDQRADQQVERAERRRQQVEHHGRGHRDLRHRGGEHQPRRPPELALPGRRRPAGSPGSPSPGQRRGRQRRAPGGSSGARRAGGRAAAALPLQSGKPRQSSPAWKLATWAPKRITTNPSAAVASTRPWAACRASRRGGAGPRAPPARSATTRSVASSSMALARWVMITQGGRASLTVTAPRSTWTTRSTSGQRWRGRRSAGSGRWRAPGHDGHGEDQQADQRRRPAVADLDQGGEVERGEPLAVAAGPMVAAAHAGAGDPDDAAEHDQAQREAAAGPGEPAQQARLIGGRCRHIARERTGPADPCQGYI